jgi:Na+-translocating ferredoxin:NAD+ oxidoreductase RNF subunit RnfB
MFFSSLVMLIVALIFAFVIWLAYKRFQVATDERILEVLKLLPGLNCAACGFASCQAMAEALVGGKEAMCPVAGREGMRKILEFLGKGEAEAKSFKAVVLCGAGNDEKVFLAEYKGIRSCKAASLYPSYQACVYGCLGFGDCVKVCPVSAIEVRDGLAHIDIQKCIGCGLCVKECPRNIIKLVPFEPDMDFLPIVACSNKERLNEVKEVCKVGCIGCGLCIKMGPEGGFVMEGSLAQVNYEEVKEYPKENWMNAVKRCPTKAIKMLEVKIEEEVKA